MLPLPGKRCGAGGGAPMRLGQGLPVVVTFGLVAGCCDAWAAAVGGLTNGPSSGCTSATVAGLSFGSWGYSGKARALQRVCAAGLPRPPTSAPDNDQVGLKIAL